MPPPAGADLPAIPSSAGFKYLNSLFPVCRGSLYLLRPLHARLLLHGLLLSTPIASRLVHAYFALGLPRHARQVFDQIPLKTPHAWNTMLSGYSKSEDPSEVLRLYRLSRAENHRPDSFGLAFAIRASTKLALVRLGRFIHAEAIRLGLESGEFVAPPLIDMYLELGSLEDAEKVFHRAHAGNSVVWGLMMKGYLQASMEVQVFALFDWMKELGLQLDPCSAVCLAQACGQAMAAKEGQVIHGFCLKKNFLESNIYLQTSLVDMYGKSGFLDFARRLFDEMPYKDVVVWSSRVAGLAQCGRAYESLWVFRQMLEESVAPNEVTLTSVLLACSHLGSLQLGKSVHGYIIRNEVELDVVTNTALLDMYAKCGSVEMSFKVFNVMPERNVFSWSAMIGGYGMHGLCSKALALFEQMTSENLPPNSVTFVSVLSACSHSGRVCEGRNYFESMIKDYKITPTDEHYSCMVDLLGRAGLVEEAESLIMNMPQEPSASMWGALLGSCRIYKKVELAEKVANRLFVLEPAQSGAHVLLSNIYAAAEMWDMVKKTREMMMNERGLQKTVGFSTIEVDKRVHIFNMTDGFDHQYVGIVELCCVLSNQMKGLGYVPDLSFTLHDIGAEAKEVMLWGS